jgi:hypothetical protein
MSVAAHRYAPFMAVVLAQLVLVVIAPSKSKPEQLTSYDPPPLASGPVAGPTTGPATGGPVAGGPVPSAGPGVVTGPTSGAVPVPGVPAGGDTRHCFKDPRFGDRQFRDFPAAPPCVASFSGNNGGATYRGVTGKTIKVVYFRKKDNLVVEGIRSSQGLHADPDDQRKFLAAWKKFANSRYELYGRTAEIVLWQSPCGTIPPEVACFRTDARNLVSKEKPFAVLYDDNTNTPEFFDELSKLGVVNIGGWHFTDRFSTARRPYHYDLQMGGDFQADLTGEYWCKKMAGRPARYAGDPALKRTIRKAAVLYPQTDANTPPALRLERILRSCGTEVLDVPYSPDTGTANQQATSQVARAKAAGVTTAVLFSDPIVPVYMTKQMTTQAYYPEHFLVGSGLIDYDAVGRLYDPGQWRHAFGVSDSPVFQPVDKQASSVVWRAAGNSGRPYSTAELAQSYLSLVFAGIQMAGPTLNPGTFERAVLGGSLEGPTWAQSKNPYLPWIHFGRGDYTAVSDAKESYWDPNAISPIDGKQGSYRHLNNGRRYGIGQWPRGESTFPLPP